MTVAIFAAIVNTLTICWFMFQRCRLERALRSANSSGWRDLDAEGRYQEPEYGPVDGHWDDYVD